MKIRVDQELAIEARQDARLLAQLRRLDLARPVQAICAALVARGLVRGMSTDMLAARVLAARPTTARAWLRAIRGARDWNQEALRWSQGSVTETESVHVYVQVLARRVR